MNKIKTTPLWTPLEEFLESQNPIQTLHQKPISVVIPTYNCSEVVGTTIEKILYQDYHYYEIIVVDANSADRTKEIVLGFQSPKIKLHSVGRFNRYEMLNRGISLAKGEYINFLFPGDYYRAHYTFSHICNLAWENKDPELIYCGSILRLPKKEPISYLKELSAKNLRLGMQPSTLPSCWFRTETLKNIGKFNPKFTMRSSLELFCRFYFQHHGSSVRSSRILLDRDKQSLNEQVLAKRFSDTFRIIYKHLGIIGVCRWLWHDREWLLIFGCWCSKIKRAFTR